MSASRALVIVLLIITFPIWIGIIGGLFGVMIGLIGGAIGIVAGVFGAVFGAFGAIFDVFFGHWHFHFSTFWFAVILICVVLLARSRRSAR